MAGEPAPAPRAVRRLPTWIVIGLALIGVALDQLCKELAIAHLDPARPIEFFGGWVRLQLTRNPGAAFSMGESVTPVFAIVAALALVAVIVFVLPRLVTRLDGVIVAALMAGIAGNLVDRLVRPPGPMHGWVVDFIWVSHFAIFNVADAFITCAAIAIALRLVFGAVHEQDAAKAASAIDSGASPKAGS
ncbi:MAG: signal peptidase II [Propionibacteriaceae bacterium]|nr:signal peptidase II [Propionibacteriaceae bacterium]